MNVKALFFAHYRDIVGQGELALALPPDATVADCAQELNRRYPTLEPLLEYGRAAVNAEFAAAEKLLHEHDEIAFMPPMSGGAG